MQDLGLRIAATKGDTICKISPKHNFVVAYENWARLVKT